MDQYMQSQLRGGVTLSEPLVSIDKEKSKFSETLMNAQGMVWRLLGDHERADEAKIELVAEQLLSKMAAGELHMTVLERLLEHLKERGEEESPTFKAVKKSLEKLDKRHKGGE